MLCNGKLLRNETDKCKLFKVVEIEEISLLEFWYFMYGSQIGTLELLVNDEIVFSRSGKQSNQWLKAQVDFQPGTYIVIQTK